MSNHSISCVLVDDEEGSLEALSIIIDRLAPNFSILGKAQNVADAFRLIEEQKPDLVFLDIQLSDQTGFDLLKMPFNTHFEVVFVTAYDEYAIQAFELNALSYLLKPVGSSAFKRIHTHVSNIFNRPLSFSNNQSVSILTNRIPIPTGSNIDYVDPQEVMYITADGSYSEIYMTTGRKTVVSKPLSYLQPLLEQKLFIRPHRSYIVNAHFIKKWNKAEGGCLIMSDNTNIPISRAGRTKVQEYFSR